MFARTFVGSVLLAFIMIALCFLGERIAWTPLLVVVYVLLGVLILPLGYLERKFRISWIVPVALSAMFGILAFVETAPSRRIAWVIALCVAISACFMVYAVFSFAKSLNARGNPL